MGDFLRGFLGGIFTEKKDKLFTGKKEKSLVLK